MSLENSTDNVVQAALILAVGSTNTDLQSVLSQDAINGYSISPIPITAMERTKLPWLNVWRFQDREDSPSDFDYQERTTIRFDYYVDPTPHGKYFDRWDILRAVWETIYKNLKMGCHPNVSSGLAVLKAAHVARYEINSATVKYLFAQDGGGSLTYPSFQGQMDFIVWSDPPAGLVTPDELLAFESLKLDWQLIKAGATAAEVATELTTALEAQDIVDINP
jgi:hypothetical protein